MKFMQTFDPILIFYIETIDRIIIFLETIDPMILFIIYRPDDDVCA